MSFACSARPQICTQQPFSRLQLFEDYDGLPCTGYELSLARGQNDTFAQGSSQFGSCSDESAEVHANQCVLN